MQPRNRATFFLLSSPFRADEWMLYDMESPRASAGRGLVNGRIFTQSGTLAVSVAQEGLLRFAVSAPLSVAPQETCATEEGGEGGETKEGETGKVGNEGKKGKEARMVDALIGPAVATAMALATKL